MFAQIIYKSFASVPTYFVLCEKGVLRVEQDGPQTDFAVGEFVSVAGAKKGEVLFASVIDLAPGEDESRLKKMAAGWESAFFKVHRVKALVDSPVLSAMVPTFESAALRLQQAVVRMQPILVRFDEDTDGITSALYLHSLVEHFVQKSGLPYPKSHFKAFQAESPIFEMKHAKHLIDLAEDYARKPLVVLLDHGASAESQNALEAIKAEGFDRMIVDHHPPWKPSLDLFDLVVHPAQHGGGSELNTGLLMYHVASTTYTAPKDWAHFAMQADRCPYALDSFFKEPVVLDYVAIGEWPLRKYAELLNDKDRVAVMYEKCLRLRQKALEKAIEHRRVSIHPKCTVEWLDISYLDADYPPKGGVVQGLHEHFEHDGPLVTVGYDKERVIFRLNEGAEAAGFVANGTIAELKNQPGLVASGGGHARAASMRLKPGKLRTVLDYLENKFGRVFG